MPVVAIFGITNDALNLVVNLLLLFLVVIWLALVWGTYADAKRRIDDPMLVGTATVASLFPFVGSIVYMIVRPPEYLEDARERQLEIAAAEATVKVGFWNVRSGKGVSALPGHAAPFVDTTNCTDPSQPLNAWGTGAMQAELSKALADPSVVALGLAESWYSVCASPDNVRKALGWKATTGEQNGVALVARYGFAGPERWQQLDTALNTNPLDTMWVVEAPVCLDAACTHSMPVYAAHWYGTGASSATTYTRQASQTVAFIGATSNAQPHVLVGDFNIWEGTANVCNQSQTNTVLGNLRAAGYLDAWTTMHAGAEGFTGMADRAGCGLPEGYAWKRIDYAWTLPTLQPRDIQRFGMRPAGDASPSDHYGIVVTLPDAAAGDQTIGISDPIGPVQPPPPTSSGGDIIVYAKNATTVAGAWSVVADPSAAGGARLANPDAGVAKLASAAALPASYFDLPFTAEAGRAYRLWIRGRAQNDSWQNDSAFVQFSGSLGADGTAAFRIGTTAATVVSIEEGSGMGVSGWGWQDNAYGAGVPSQPIYFATSAQTIRIQVREDGLSIDQIVLSPVRFFTTAPGVPKNDSTILPLDGSTAPPADGSGATIVQWINAVHATATGDVLVKSGGCADCPDAGAVSQQSIGANGAFSFTVAAGQVLVAGLGHDTSASTSYAIDYAFAFPASGVFEIRERGTYRTEGSFSASDVFRIGVVQGRITYYRNGIAVYSSAVASASPLVVDSCLETPRAAITSATVASR